MRSRGLGGATLWRLFDFLRPRRGQYFGAMLVMAAGSVGAGERLFTGYIVKLFGDAISGKDLGLLIKSVAYWGLYALGMLIVTPIFYYLWRTSIVQGMANLRQAVFSHLQRLPLATTRAVTPARPSPIRPTTWPQPKRLQDNILLVQSIMAA